MNKKTINRILAINKEFYEKISKDFDTTRKYPWEGWAPLLNIIKEKNNKKALEVLDVACGNGRFLDYLAANLKQDFIYTGVDNNKDLLAFAENMYKDKWKEKNAVFKYEDVLGEKFTTKKYDVVVAFGITHHIPNEKRRQEWIKYISKILKPEGILAISFWNYNKDKRFQPLDLSQIKEELNIAVKEIEDNDYFIRWNNNAIRYVHIYSQEELKIIFSILSKNNLVMLADYEADSKEKLNRYCILTQGSNIDA